MGNNHLEILNTILYLGEINPKRLINEFEEKILSLKDPELSYCFAKNVEGADIKAHEQVILKLGHKDLLLKFMESVNGADKEMLQDEIDRKSLDEDYQNHVRRLIRMLI